MKKKKLFQKRLQGRKVIIISFHTNSTVFLRVDSISRGIHIRKRRVRFSKSSDASLDSVSIFPEVFEAAVVGERDELACSSSRKMFA